MLKFDNEVEFILGRPNFWYGPVARNLRQLGHKIEEKSEAEQAYVLHWMLTLYEEHGEGWREEFDRLMSKKNLDL